MEQIQTRHLANFPSIVEGRRMGEVKHIPVMSEEIIAILSKIDNLSYVIDATVGVRGHAFEILSSFPELGF